ncbi:MAG: hypothetical protein V3S24_21160 [Candidatus Tectomicrobia bacterium]
MEARGIPTVMICTDEFSLLGRSEAESLGMPSLPIALVPHPLGGQKPESIEHKAAAAITQIVEILTTSETALMQQFLGKV